MSARDLPDARGHFDRFGGRFVPEALQAALSQLTGTFEAAVTDPDFLTELEDLRREYAGRPSPCLLYTSPSPRDLSTSRMPSSA